MDNTLMGVGFVMIASWMLLTIEAENRLKERLKILEDRFENIKELLKKDITS